MYYVASDPTILNLSNVKEKNRKLEIFVQRLCFISNSRGKLSLFLNTNMPQNVII
jgi:hypothetical protein